jgi:hypothetical protein
VAEDLHGEGHAEALLEEVDNETTRLEEQRGERCFFPNAVGSNDTR